MILFKLCEHFDGSRRELRGLRIEANGRVYTKVGSRPSDFEVDRRWVRQCPGYAPEDVDAIVEEKMAAGWELLGAIEVVDGATGEVSHVTTVSAIRSANEHDPEVLVALARLENGSKEERVGFNVLRRQEVGS